MKIVIAKRCTMDKRKQIYEIMCSEKYNTLPKILEGLLEIFEDSAASQIENNISSDIVDIEFLKEIKNLPINVSIAFGKTLRDIKCVINDNGFRSHDIYLRYNGIKKLNIVSVDLPCTVFNEQSYTSIEEVVVAFMKQLNNFQNYFYELENIDRSFTVMDPVKPQYKDDYRNIKIDEKTWLHIEVTADGSATNVHLIGQSDLWQEKLQKGLLSWDQDKNIVDNIISIFDINYDVSCNAMNIDILQKELLEEASGPTCGICFCTELPDYLGLPQPLCQNGNCDVHFHKSCLFQWLVACEGGRLPAFGVMNGSCPTCLQPISCSERG